ncbi:hypothetical protein Cgig2_017215 [Carnegiea gigantea]|uniref:Uncharacterized protein n=1 Tax=Carnegiea gigantea TaxID=171969 RepID=A0A9Q1KI91_9CARY|nr:hypothetical protein Cgig2_017215 [Carnegiea gigantea]
MAGDDRVAVSASSQQWRMKLSLEGKVVMITGASSGIGREFCLDLAESGCRIIAAARRKDRLKTVCDQINSAGGVRAIAVQLDVTADGRTIDVADAFGRIDALINNAGIRGNLPNLSDSSLGPVLRECLKWLIKLLLDVLPGRLVANFFTTRFLQSIKFAVIELRILPERCLRWCYARPTLLYNLVYC